ncbi:hypothetical protein, partial [Lentimicrobium sp.]|uniref:hypothetical protein n=1 Tax=Lentimicrobium sp. TaxID=2034841 RepID=UPI00345E3794
WINPEMICYLCYAAAIILQGAFAALLKCGLLLKLPVSISESGYCADCVYSGDTDPPFRNPDPPLFDKE